ncbi:MAG: hypothetical protein HY904_14215 [Deltaproteobacteria bacterium]|nr:hypothetical protein [Deltaproteobacteria bacterium]
MVRQRAWGWVACVAVLGAGCTVERLFPDKVGIGVARLTMRTAGNLVALTQADTRCGFSSPDVVAAAVVDGELGDVGSVTWTVTDCAMDFGAQTETGVDCNGDKTLVGGRARVSGTMVLHGTLTGNPANPVVPDGAEAVEFRLEAALEEFQVLSSASSASMLVHQGNLAFVARPHLAVSASLGVCAVATSNLTLEAVHWGAATAAVTSDGRTFETEIRDSALEAQVGRWLERENDLSGTITVWSNKITIPTRQTLPLLTTADSGLDPEYDAEKFINGFACKPDLALPVSYQCGSLTPVLAEGASRLSIALFGTLVSLVDADARCGFSSLSAATQLTLQGETGRAGGTATWGLGAGCTLELPAATPVKTDCNGVRTLAGGKFTATGTKTIRGILTGDPAQPVIPTSRDPAEITLTITLDGFEVSFSNNGNALRAHSGTLAGTLRPRVARDTTTGACSVSTPVVAFDAVTWTNADLLLTADGNHFKLHVDGSHLDAQNGTRDARTNYLDGAITLSGEEFTVPLDRERLALDPTYDAAVFDTSWRCTPNMVVPESDAECLMTPVFAEGAARLTAQNFGAVISILDKDTRCGFSSPGAQVGLVTTGVLGERGGTATWRITTPCVLDFPVQVTASTDCAGATTTVQGRVAVTGTKTLRGILSGDPGQPIVPTSRDPAEITAHVEFTEFTATSSASPNSLTWKTGSLDGTLRPRLAVDTTSGACAISTPIAAFSELRYQEADVALHAGPKTFLLHVNASSLNAQNGNADAHTNWLSGTMTVDGTAIAVPLDAARPLLNPDYNQQTFDASWACTPNMRPATQEQDCNFTRVLAENTGRLFIQTAGTLATMLNTDSGCGFENLVVQATPDETVGSDGEQGFLRWEIQNCRLGYDSMTVFQEDCFGGEIAVSGWANMDSGRTVHGIRETLYLVLASIRPDTPDDVEIRINNVRFEEFTAAYNVPATGVPKGYLVIHGGQFSATIHPYLGERASDPGKFDVAMPIPYSTSNTVVQAQDLTATLYSEGKQFNVRVNQANVDGQNGTWRGRSNSLRGTISVDNQAFTLDIPLKPDFNAATFPQGYLCTEDLAGPVPPG